MVGTSIYPSPPSPQKNYTYPKIPDPKIIFTTRAYTQQTTYVMPDVDYRLSQAFKNLSGETPPSADVVESIYKHTRFDTRFYEERATFSSPSSSASAAPPTFLIFATFHAPKDGSAAAGYTTWFKTSHLPKLEKTPGFVRAKTYETVVSMVLDRWNFMAAPEEVPQWLVMSEFAGETVPNLEQVEGGVDVGVYRIGRVYSEEDWGSVGK